MISFFDMVKVDEQIQQGDIFLNLPFCQINNSRIIEINEKSSEKQFLEIDLSKYTYKDSEEKKILVPFRILPGIIISQNCDVLRSDSLSFCAIRPFSELDSNFPSKKNEDKKIEYLTKHYKFKEKYFYLPKEGAIGFDDRMAVDFSTVYQIKTDVVTQLVNSRKAKLNETALKHFRQKISNYFTRFAFDPWYLLTKDEFQTYYANLSESEQKITCPCEWQ